MTEQAKWTWLVYMAGDNNLEGAGRADLAEMKRVGSSGAINILVQFDTEEGKTTRYRVEKGKLKALAQMPGVDSGDPKVLADFLRWGVERFPAKRYLVDIWNHGGGWENLPADYDYDGIRAAQPRRAAKLRRLTRSIFRTTAKAIHKRPLAARAIAIDCGSHDYLDNQELRKALAKALPAGRRFDVLACDACLMNMLEIAYEMKDTAQVMIGSEEVEPGAGWPYAAVLGRLARDPDMGPKDLARIVVDEYAKSFASSRETATQSALDLARTAALSKAVDALAKALLAGLPRLAGAISLSQQWAQKFDMPEYVDLADFCNELAENLPHEAAVQVAITSVRKALAGGASPFVIANRTVGAKVARASGVSIYMPPPGQYAPDYRDLLFSKDAAWAKLLEALQAPPVRAAKVAARAT